MLGAFAQAFRTPDLRRKLLFTMGIVAIFRLGSFIPTPGVDYVNVKQCVAAQDNSVLGLINLFSGGAMLQLSVFALGIMPYITASIIVQLLRVVIPHFEALHQEGQAGTAKLTQYTRYLTIFLAVLQATTIITTARTGLLFNGCGMAGTDGAVIANDSVWTILLAILVMTAGTGLIMWLAELITERGVGNGMSLLIFMSIASSFPSALWTVANTQGGFGLFLLVIALALVLVTVVVFVEQSQRRVPVQYAKRMVGRRVYGGTSTYIPIKINMSGVIPVIFASSILMLPTLAAQFGDQNAGWVQWIIRNFGQGTTPLYMVLFAVLILFFVFFYTSITFNPEEVADNMKRYGGFIPGIRAGRPTAEYLQYVINRITSAGAIYLVLIALIPTIAFVLLNISNVPFGGTSLLIIVSVGLETVKQIDSQLQQRHYEGILR
ncbi:protein translocase subunit secY/sec61 alpha [Salana multivorans]|uniref:Protein translocase subunit SecY n=1 Tax=Salana multivorans TaxID=120377 RepID=A0A3N2DC40_9MICO|nr:preprotein translocase subunit SecY [Salana multivorans]OJX97769.1 MAG: preprotein translocase subunit SecY [Micrococcales bacterium 73-15]ROR97365.1 protein translocase subunit secY/sec61 alpha [Salana multivorans]